MNSTNKPEWEGLETFVEEVRRLEAPEVPDVHVNVTSAPVPGVNRHSSAVRVGWLFGGVAAAAGIMWLMQGGPESQTVRDAQTPGVAHATVGGAYAESAALSRETDDIQRATASMLSPWPALLHAQSVAGMRPQRYPPLTAIDVSRLRIGRRAYVRLSANDYHASLPHESWSNTLDTVRYRGARAWRLVRRVDETNVRGEPTPVTDTLWLRRDDLRPMQRRSFSAPLFVAVQQFTDSTVVEHDSIRFPEPELKKMPASMRKRAPFAFTVHRRFTPESPYIASAEMLRLLLRAAPLSGTWRASVQVPTNVYNALQPDTSGWVNLRVVGVDTVQLFSGRFPTWRVAVEGGARPETWYVSQQTGETLITEGPLSASYPESRTILLHGLEETQRAPRVRRQ